MMRLTMLVAALAIAACSSDDENPNPNGARTTTTSLSSAYSTNCARCHGDKGEGQTIDGNVYPRLPGPNSADAATYTSLVRTGKGELMTAFDASIISDADLQADFTWLTTTTAR